MRTASIKTLPILFLLFATASYQLFAMPTGYEDVFGDDWKKAQAYVSENRSWMEPLLRKNHIPFNEAVAVIFPELVRYSALRDKMEITLLKALYVNLGDDYADFSIGRFQVKPSFANIIHEEASSVMTKRSGISFKNISDFEDVRDYRKSIVADMEDPAVQFKYIVAFIRICEKKFRTARMNEADRIKFISTAYNYGPDKSFEQIQKMVDKKFFTTKLIKSDLYSYSDISLYWYTNQQIK